MLTAFVDSSALFKKYYQEVGQVEFYDWLERITEIYIAPVTVLELYSAIHRRLHEESFTYDDAKMTKAEINEDMPYYQVVQWNEYLQEQGCVSIEKFGLKPADSIQLGAALIVQPDVFLTSDKRLFNAAQIELKNAVFI